MKYLFTVLMLALWVGLPVVVEAQTTARPLQVREASQAGPDGLTKLHLTDRINSTPEAKAALADFQARKAAGLLPDARKSASALGDTMNFRVLNDVERNFENIDFKLMAIDPATPPRFQIWVELAELDNGTVDQAVLDSLVRALGMRTPSASVNPNAGIIENDEVIFGEPPDIDADGLTDILLLDIRDDYNPPDVRSFFAGFVYGGDLVPQGSGGSGNLRDILYLDTNPTLTVRGIDEVAVTAVHEYQHLIHFNYDNNEDSFINEGLSEYAEVALGYQGRTITYLDDPIRSNVALLRFLPDDSFDDRQRGALFINYIADQFGLLPDSEGRGGIGKITRESASGSAGLRNALIAMQAGLSLEDLIADFHAANFLNDTDLDARYGYTTPRRLGIRAVPAARFDGRVESETPATEVDLTPGAVVYLLWEQVKDITITLDPVTDVGDLRADIFLFGTDGSFEGTTPLSFSGNTPFEGEYGRVVVVLTNVNPDRAPRGVIYSAQWAEPEVQVELLTTQYDTGQAEAPNGENPFFQLTNSTNPGVATRFVVPFADRATALDKVFIAPYFLSQFSNGGQPEDAPRDLTLKVWAAGPGGLPGEELFSQVIQDERSGNASLTLSFIEVDLSSVPELFSLPDTVFVGYTNAGTDANSFVFATSLYDVEQVSLVSSNVDQGWGGLWLIGSGDSRPYEGTVIPIRAQFAIPTATAVDDAAEVPAQIVLYPNFPNPFNPSTSVRYSLPRAAEVRLAVYDLLGREVAVLVDGMGAPGEYVVQVDARQWASGVYFYTLQTAGQTLTQRMVLVK